MRVYGLTYKQLVDRYCTGYREQLLYGIGFIAGQAEKVHSGACGAAMCRPSLEFMDDLWTAVLQIADVYGLECSSRYYSVHRELWIFRPECAGIIQHMGELPPNTPQWHFIRATLCGIQNVDTQYHMRAGYMEPCETCS